MKCIFVLLAVALVPVTVAAQQPETDACSDINYSSPRTEVIRCLDFQRQKAKEAEAKAVEAKKAADELNRVADDARKLRSTNKDQQIDGSVDVIKDLNSKGNSNPASKEVTDKSLSLIDQFAHVENELLNKTSEIVRSGLELKGDSPSSFNAGQQHQLNESARGVEPQQLSIEQQFQNQEQRLLSGPAIKAPMPGSQSAKSINETQESTLEEQFQRQQAKMLASAASVKRVADADRAMEAAAQAERDREAKEALAAQIKRNRDKPADPRVAMAIEMAQKEKKEQAAFDREERAEEAANKRAQQAAFEAAFGPPQNQATPYIPYVPSYTPPVSSYGTYSPSYNPSYSPQNGSSGSYLDQGAARPISGSGSFDIWSCMSNLLTESQCLRDHVKPIELSPGCFDDPGKLGLPSCFGGSSSPSSPTAAPATNPASNASSTPPPTPAAAPATAPKTAP